MHPSGSTVGRPSVVTVDHTAAPGTDEARSVYMPGILAGSADS